jgi:hypothetical protein
MQDYKLGTIKATGTTDTWFKALRRTLRSLSFTSKVRRRLGLSSARDMGRLLEKIKRGEVSEQISQ